MDRVRVGVIGTSRYADGVLLSSLNSHEGAKVAALCGRNQARAQEVAAKYDIPQIYDDYRQMIDTAKLDALVVASPDDLHYEMTMYALDAGLHVMCDKPLANKADDARQMLDKAEAAGVKHMVMHTWRWLPQMQYIKHLLEEGYLGRAYQSKFRFSFGFMHKRDYAWRIDADRANGALGDMGSHMIDMARWFLGDVASVSATLRSFVEHDGVEGRPLNPANDSALLLLDFVDGPQASLELSMVNHLADSDGIAVTLYGENGTLDTDYYFNRIRYEVRGALREEQALHPLEMPAEFRRGFDQQDDMFAAFRTESIGPRLFIDRILENKAPAPNFYDGCKTQQVIDAALELQATGRRIAIT